MFVSVLLVVVSACKKEFKTNTIVNFHVYNPISGEGLAGVPVRVIEQEDVSGAFQVSSEYKSTVIWEGITDQNGRASYTFNAKKKDKFTYWQSADIGYITANNRKLLKQAEFQEEKKNAVNENEYTYTVPATYVLLIKNVNCLSQNDRFRYRVDWLYNTGLVGWSNWSLDQFGCYESLNVTTGFNDYLIYEYEVERNGITNTYLDTFYINPNSVDTLKIFY